MRYVFTIWFALALSLALMAGCSDENGQGGSGGTGGTGGSAGAGGTGGTVPECQVPADCDDAQECTTDTCAGGMCEYAAVADGTSCFLGGYYASGICVSGDCREPCENDGDCYDYNTCTTDACDLVDAVCDYIPIEDGTTCGEAAVCFGGSCRGLECEVDADCNDDEYNECTAQTCVSFGFCSDPFPIADGTSCAGGVCQSGECSLGGSVLPCTEQGIRNAIAAGGGPYTFDCDGPTTIVTEAEIVINNDVILDGEGKLTVDGHYDHRVFSIGANATVELHGFTITRGKTAGGSLESRGAGIQNGGTLLLTSSTVSDSDYGGIYNFGGTLTLINSIVSDNIGAGVDNHGSATLTNTTMSGNSVGIQSEIHSMVNVINSTLAENTAGISISGGTLILISDTISGNTNAIRSIDNPPQETYLEFRNTLFVNNCVISTTITTVSDGYSMESPGDTCALDADNGDEVNLTAEQLALGPLQDNGGPTRTIALLPGSVAIDVVPQLDCVQIGGSLTTDQRGEPRPEPGGTMCDVGAFEVQP